MKHISIFLFIALVLTGFSYATDHQLTAKEQMNKLEPLVGKWKTMSYFSGKEEGIPGDLEYRRVLGNNWLRIEFVGKHPTREYWEAYVMMKYDTTKKAYISYSFFGADEPSLMTGSWISDKTFRLESTDPKGNSNGIDYTVKEDGSIYQENWSLDTENQRKIRLKTYYTKVTQ